MRRAFVLLSLAIASGAAFAAPPPIKPMTPSEGIAAAAVLPDGAMGMFQFTVRSFGDDSDDGPEAEDDPVYLNSETNRHANSNLSVMILPAAVKDLENELGGSLRNVLIGKRVTVTGSARQQKVDLLDKEGRATGRTYLQTRIIVNDADQLELK